MPPPPTYTVDEIFDAVKELHFYYLDTESKQYKLYGLRNEIWTRAEEKLPKMSRKYIYLYISTKRNGIHERLLAHQNLKLIKSPPKNVDTSYESNWSIEESMKIPFAPLRTTINVPKSEWMIKQLDLILYDENKRPSLKPGWTNAIYSLLWEHLKLPCPFAFKYANINDKPGEIFLTIRGSCRECNNIINLYIPTIKPFITGLDINVSTFDTKGIEHTKKRYLSGTKRSAVVKELHADNTYSWRRKQANEMMDFGDPEPADLYLEIVLRKAKQIDNDIQLNVLNETDPIASLLKLKYKAEFAGFIKEVAFDKFYVFYWSPEQIHLYKEWVKCSDCKSSAMSIDATGSVIKRMEKPDGSSQPIFLYQAVVPFHGKILPVCQMVSEKHDTNIMSYWLREWQRYNVPCPVEIVTDYSLALLNAVCLAFNNCPLSQYINICVQKLQALGSTAFLPCIIRIDIAHMIKLVCRWKCFHGKHSSIKDFYVRSIAMLTKCSDLNTFRHIFCDVLVVAQSETESVQNDTDNCFLAQKRLLAAMKNDGDGYFVEDDNNKSEEMYTDNTLDDCTSLEFINDLVLECNSLLSEGERPNPYFCRDFARNFIRIGNHFPIWTGVMSRNKSSVATSSYSEEYFREVKQLILKGQKPPRADKFLIIHMRSLAGATKILHALHQKGSSTKSRREVRIPDIVASDVPHAQQENLEMSIEINGSREENYSDITLCNNSYSYELPQTNITKRKLESPITLVENSAVVTISHETTESFKEICPEHDRKTKAKNDIEDSPNAYLNRIETWKGQNKDTKTRGKYLRPCPDIEQRHKRPRSIMSTVPILKNGMVLGPVNLQNKNIFVRNTCPIDSVSQSILVAYRDWATFHDIVDTTQNNTFFKFIQLLSTSGCVVKTYKERASIMSKIKKIDGGVLNCMMNVSNLIKNYLLPNHESYTIEHKCLSCKQVNNETSIVVEVDVNSFYVHGMTCLEQVMNERIERIKPCHTCNSSNTKSTVITGSLIVVDVECLQWSRLAKNLGYPEWTGTFTLSQIPQTIKIQNDVYTILSVIEFIGDAGQSFDAESEVADGHYVAHVRRITGRWEVHNDLITNNKPLTETARMMSEKKKMSLLIYIKMQ